MSGWNVLIAVHALSAVFAVGLGALVLLARPKGNRRHRRTGTAWVLAMYVTIVSSFGIRELEPGRFSWIHGLSAWTFLTLTVAVWGARTGRRRVHRDFVVGSYLGLLGAGLAAVAFPDRLVPQLVVTAPFVSVAALAVVAAAVALVARLTLPKGVPGRTRVRPARAPVASSPEVPRPVLGE